VVDSALNSADRFISAGSVRWDLIRRLAFPAALFVSFAFFAVPVLRSKQVGDPVKGNWTDHLRYRYCSSLVISDPWRAMTTPLGFLAAQDTQKYKRPTWLAEPCHQAGVVHLAIHAPFQWLVEREVLAEHTATNIYVLLLLVVAHLTLYILGRGSLWWAALILYPILLRNALYGIQENIPILFGLLCAMAWGRGRLLLALAFWVLAFSAYTRWIIWLPPLLYLCWRERARLYESVQELRSPGARVCAVVLVLVFGWSLLSTIIVGLHRIAPPGTLSPMARGLIWIFVALWGVYWLIDRKSALAPFMLVSGLFLVVYKGLAMHWYFGPLWGAAPFGRSKFEVGGWAVAAGLMTDLVMNVSVLEVRSLFDFAFKSWSALGHGG